MNGDYFLMDIALLWKLALIIKTVMDRDKKSFIAIIAVVIFILALLHFGLAEREPESFTADGGYRPVMGTFARVIVIAADERAAQACIEAAFGQISKIDELMSYHNPDSEISRLNRSAFENPVKVTPLTFQVIKKAIEFSQLTDSAFDVTVGPLVDLWRQAGDANTVPTEQQLQEAGSRVGWDKLILKDNEQSVQFAVDGMQLDLGGIAKGFAIDRAVEAIEEVGGLGAMVDIGGDIRCYGKTPKGQKYWLVGLQNPNLESEEQILFTLKLSAGAVATSGGYQRYFLIGGRHYSHIINERTGSTAEALSSVTIIADSATDADALATAVSVIGAERGIELIENRAGTEAIIISAAPEYKVTETSGAEKFIR
jgi:thiamine biosynthesis lipoprotein